jgi:hypothetical protein
VDRPTCRYISICSTLLIQPQPLQSAKWQALTSLGGFFYFGALELT